MNAAALHSTVHSRIRCSLTACTAQPPPELRGGYAGGAMAMMTAPHHSRRTLARGACFRPLARLLSITALFFRRWRAALSAGPLRMKPSSGQRQRSH